MKSWDAACIANRNLVCMLQNFIDSMLAGKNQGIQQLPHCHPHQNHPDQVLLKNADMQSKLRSAIIE